MSKFDKLRFYGESSLTKLVPNSYYRKQLSQLLSSPLIDSTPEILQRVDYYFKAPSSFSIDGLDGTVTSQGFQHEGHNGYKIDLFNILRYFAPDLPFQYYFGDQLAYPTVPTFIKARPIPKGAEGESNSVLLRLNSVRHFRFTKDPVPFHEKKDIALWRGVANNNSLRETLVEQFQGHPKCDCQGTHRRSVKYEGSIERMTHLEQFQYKFIISIEGVDVATNTKWIMNSNSLCFMPKPTWETWFMEGTLQPNHHYVLLNDDFSNLEEKIDYYRSHPEEALEIIQNAQDYVQPFKNKEQERLIGLLVAQRYFDSCRK